MTISPDTIVAIATPPGRGGIGIIRISGSLVRAIASEILGFKPKPRYAHHAEFLDADRLTLDQGVALFFPSPRSFTGEDILEILAHGGPVILDMLLQRLLSLGNEIENQNTENLTVYKIHNMPELEISINNFIYKNFHHLQNKKNISALAPKLMFFLA